MSSIDFEECCHKLMKVTLPPGQESELPSMVVECCSQERTFSKFYGLIGERFSKINRLWADLFEASFAQYYETIHRYETNRLRNIARFFGHMLSSDAIGWHVLSVIHLNEEETTSSSRIFIKILFQDLVEAMGMAKLQERLKDEILRPSYEGIFPTDNPRNTRFSINYFTSIGMGVLTEEMREHLKNLPKPAMPALPAAKSDSDSASVSSYSSYSSYSDSRSPSRSRSRSRGRSYSRSLSRSRSPSRDRSYSRPPSRSRSRSRSYSRSPSRERGRGRTTYRGRSYTPSRSPTPRSKTRRGRDYSPSRSRSPAPRSRRREASYTPSRSPARRRQRSVSSTPPRKNSRRSPSRSRRRERSPYRSRRYDSRSVSR